MQVEAGRPGVDKEHVVLQCSSRLEVADTPCQCLRAAGAVPKLLTPMCSPSLHSAQLPCCTTALGIVDIDVQQHTTALQLSRSRPPLAPPGRPASWAAEGDSEEDILDDMPPAAAGRSSYERPWSGRQSALCCTSPQSMPTHQRR